jgi:hypothetical protein
MRTFLAASAALFAFAGSTALLGPAQARAADINVDVDVYRPRPVVVAPRTVYIAPTPVCSWRTVRVRAGERTAVRRVHTCI